MTNRYFCRALAAVGVAGVAVAPAVAEAATSTAKTARAAGALGQKPDVVIIVADDLGWGDVSYHGSAIRTPNIDRLVRQGIELDRYYTAPVSSPTRAGLLTGRYPNRFGIRQT
ncbi:hypothetical protein FACS1894159_08190 [Bacteroidia bacterium]|nr:hypothetical protein FACS1894159_08190 [Bacteroidia bacterium]